MPQVRAQAEQGERARVSLHEQALPIRLAPRWSRRGQHPLQVSWGIWRPPRSRSYGTSHGYAVHPACPRSSRTARSRVSLKGRGVSREIYYSIAPQC
jgi:hypothetical protein